ncbi:MAG TPA: condensation domain-containing protein [Clostridiaceae bacterium]|nr:condensation domain-containing protein [Clostridiaceae bacterium]
MESNVYNLTNPQKSIWFTEQFYKGTPIENITGCVIVLEKLNLKALQKAINLFVKSNDSFRLKFTVKDDKPLQYLSSFSEFEIENVMVNTDEDIKDIENEMSNTPFEVLDNLLFSFKTFTFPDGHGGFVITAHHLISDAWTAGLVVNEIMDYYEKIINSQIIDNQNPSYLDYITSEQEYLNSEKFNKDKEFWNEIFKTVPEVATIPSINVENSNSSLSCKAKRKQFVIPKETMNLINEFCKQNKASAFNFFMAVLAIYLSRVSSLDDFTIGTPILNRGNFKEKQTTGMYISTIPFRISINHKIPFAEFLSNISADFSKIFRHQKYPYQYLLEDLRKKDSSIPNLYNILLSYQNVRSNKQTSDINYESSWVGNNFISDDIDIHLYDMNDTGDINIAYDYLISKYSIDDICSIHARFLYIINQVLENNDITLNEIEIVTPDEKKKILYDFNNTSADYPRDKTITQLFEEQVEKTPDNIAVVFENQKLTYRELNERANSLANYLRSQKIGRNDIVGIMVNRSLEMIISILAVLKSGACYIPIDPEYPQDRIEYMLNNSSAKLLLTFKRLENKVTFDNKLFVELDNELYNSNKDNLININEPDDLAYIIYTSGSTGKPKGVMLKHSNINNFIQGMCNVVDFNSEKTIVSVTTISFDIFVLESLLPLQRGLKIVVATENEQNDIRLFNALCLKNNVNIIQTTPSRFQVLISNLNELDYLEGITDILVGGESFPKMLLGKLHQLTHANIYDVYGPTETAVWSTVKNLTNESSITIGKPIANTRCYILDNNKNLLPTLTPRKFIYCWRWSLRWLS